MRHRPTSRHHGTSHRLTSDGSSDTAADERPRFNVDKDAPPQVSRRSSVCCRGPAAVTLVADEVWAGRAETTAFTVQRLREGTPYYFAVHAVNRAGHGDNQD